MIVTSYFPSENIPVRGFGIEVGGQFQQPALLDHCDVTQVDLVGGQHLVVDDPAINPIKSFLGGEGRSYFFPSYFFLNLLTFYFKNRVATLQYSRLVFDDNRILPKFFRIISCIEA